MSAGPRPPSLRLLLATEPVPPRDRTRGAKRRRLASAVGRELERERAVRGEHEEVRTSVAHAHESRLEGVLAQDENETRDEGRAPARRAERAKAIDGHPSDATRIAGAAHVAHEAMSRCRCHCRRLDARLAELVDGNANKGAR